MTARLAKLAGKCFLSLWRLTLPVPLLLGAGVIASWCVFSRPPRLLTTVYGDLGSWLGGELWLFGLVKFLLPFVLILGIYFFGNLLARLWPPGNHWRYAKAFLYLALVTLAGIGLAVYPLAKERVAIFSMGEANASTAVVIVFRGYHDDWTSRLIFTDPAATQSTLPPTWPVLLLDKARTSTSYVERKEMNRLVEVLKDGSFFGFSEQYDPRPTLDYSGVYIAIYQNGKMKRVFRRVTDRGHDQLRRLADAISAEVPS